MAPVSQAVAPASVKRSGPATDDVGIWAQMMQENLSSTEFVNFVVNLEGRRRWGKYMNAVAQ